MITIVRQTTPTQEVMELPNGYTVEITGDVSTGDIEGKGNYRPMLFVDGELVWSGASGYVDVHTAKDAAIRQYHIESGDLRGIPEDKVIQIEPWLLVAHPKNPIIYQNDEETVALKERLDVATPYISEYIVTPEGVIVSGHRRNHVISEINAERKASGLDLITLVPALVRQYGSEDMELEALILENCYRESKSPDTLLREATVLYELEKRNGRRRQMQARVEGVPEDEQARSIEIVAQRFGFKVTELKVKMKVTKFIDSLKSDELKQLWSKLRDKSPNTAIALWKLWEQEREQLTDEHFSLALQALVSRQSKRISAKKALVDAKNVLAERKRKEQENIARANSATRSNSNSGNSPSGGGAIGATNAATIGSTSTENLPVDDDEKTEGNDEETDEAPDWIPNDPKDERAQWWQSASKEQRRLWKLAKEARDLYGDLPSNNRMTPSLLVSRCLEVIDRDEFDYDPFADLTKPDHIPSVHQYTVKDDFLKKEGGKYTNQISGDVFANILWNQQKDCLSALCYWIDQGEVNSMFVVSQSSIVNLPSCQELIKKHGLVVVSWSGRLEYEPGGILIYDCQFPLEGDPKRIPSGNQRYDTVILFYSGDLSQKMACHRAFNDLGLVTYQKDVAIASELEAEDTIRLPVWVGSQCNWYGYELVYTIDNEGLFTVSISKDGEPIEGSEEIEGEAFYSEEDAKNYAMVKVMGLLSIS